LTSLCRRQLRPPRDLVRPLQRSKLGAVQVLGDFLPLALDLVAGDKDGVDLMPPQAYWSTALHYVLLE